MALVATANLARPYAALLLCAAAMTSPARAQRAGPVDNDIVGMFSLRSVDGREVPTGAITDGRIDVSADGRWDLRINWHTELFRSARTYGDRGNIIRSGETVTFVSTEYGDSRATFRSDALTLEYYWPVQQRVGRFVFVKDRPVAQADPPRVDPGDTRITWTRVSAGAYAACGLDSAGTAYCWGLRAEPPGSPGGDRPSPVARNLTFTAISTGSAMCPEDGGDQGCASRYHACGITTAGEAYCWGANQFGQLGDGTTAASPTPRSVSTGARFTAISAGYGFTCGVTTAAALSCWGDNQLGELGVGANDKLPHPLPREVGHGALTVSASRGYACVVDDEGAAYCWGASSILLNENGYHLSPSRVPTDQRFVSVSAGVSHVCGLTKPGAVFCWGGENNFSEAGPGDARGLSRIPVRVPGIGAAALAAGARHTCAVSTDGKAFCWGANNSGQLGAAANRRCGIDDWPCAAVPIPVNGDASFRSLSAGERFTCGVTIVGAAMCWGDNSRGQLGTGNRLSRAAPALVASPTGPAGVR